MRVTIRKKNLEVTPALAEYIEKKILKPIRKLLKNAAGEDLPLLDLEVERTTRHHHKGEVYRAEANLSLGKIFFHAEAHDEDIRAACDFLEKELEREITTKKGKLRAQTLRAERKTKRELRLDPSARTDAEKEGREISEG